MPYVPHRVLTSRSSPPIFIFWSRTPRWRWQACMLVCTIDSAHCVCCLLVRLQATGRRVVIMPSWKVDAPFLGTRTGSRLLELLLSLDAILITNDTKFALKHHVQSTSVEDYCKVSSVEEYRKRIIFVKSCPSRRLELRRRRMCPFTLVRPRHTTTRGRSWPRCTS